MGKTETITWISVEERLPHEYETVLVPSNGHSVSVYRAGNLWLTTCTRRTIDNVTHWAEMPKGPSDE
jgi:hypothetical protein